MRRSRLHVTGASGAGTTTLARALADHWAVPHADVDDYFWVPSDPPYVEKRPASRPGSRSWRSSSWPARRMGPVPARCSAGVTPSWRAATRWCSWTLDPEERLRRIEGPRGADAQRRPSLSIQAVVGPPLSWNGPAGYDDPAFDGRSRVAHERWLAGLDRPVLRLDSASPPEVLRDQVLTWEPVVT